MTMTPITHATRYAIRIAYRGMQGQWCQSRTRHAATREAAEALLDSLVLGHGWVARLVSPSGDILRRVQP